MYLDNSPNFRAIETCAQYDAGLWVPYNETDLDYVEKIAEQKTEKLTLWMGVILTRPFWYDIKDWLEAGCAIPERINSTAKWDDPQNAGLIKW